MSKSILAIDTPNKCVNCNFCEEIDIECIVCRAALDNIGLFNRKIENMEIKPDWCPLKEMPQKKKISASKTMTDLGWIEGFNACIDEILKEHDTE